MPARIHIPTGEHISRFIVLGKGTRPCHWLCLCICGKRIEVRGEYLRRKRTKSCGCCMAELVSKGKSKHGHSVTQDASKMKMYNVWISMRDRCNRPSKPGYQNYGGRGITVCERWNSFANFLADMGNRPSPKHSIDRIDNDSGYSPENCRWATRQQQSENRRNVHKVSMNGITDTIKKHCRRLGINYGTITSRIRAGEEPIAAMKRKIRAVKKRTHSMAAESEI